MIRFLKVGSSIVNEPVSDNLSSKDKKLSLTSGKEKISLTIMS